MKFENKIAIITGGARDIGRAISIKLASEGAKVVINYLNNVDAANETVREIESLGASAISVCADVSQSDGVKYLIDATVSKWGDNIDILVNNAGGIVARKTLEEMDEAFFERVMRLNLFSTFFMTKAVVTHMSAGGAIVNLASLAGRDGGGGGASAYSTSKGAVMTFTRAMAKELGPKGIRVNALCPGMISTAFHDQFTSPEIRTKVAAATALRREGDAREVADAVAFLASSESSYLTGVNLDINGGVAMF